MELEKNTLPEKNKKNSQDKAEEFIDNTADKIHKSETSRKADKSFEKTTKNIFRKAGKLWEKPEHYFKK